MNMRKVLMALIFYFLYLPAVGADHHRGHAVMHLDEAIYWFDHSISDGEGYRQRVSNELPQHLKNEWDALAGSQENENEDNEVRIGWINSTRDFYPELSDVFDKLKVPTKYAVYAGKYLLRMENARETLTTGGDLDEARRIMNSPGFSPEIDSVLWGFEVADSIWLTLFRYDANVAGVATKRRKANQAAHFALWHIHDAIREEVYLDLDFICAGPNNHCE